jgi:16S rRNA (guanine966-N2)-methyltransferase
MKKTSKLTQATNRGDVRIIAGDWRGRKLPVLSQAGLRPTSDRMRETLFNWLQFDIAGARCLDAFAGSGALGFEALSRGAAEVVFLEKNLEAANQLKANAQLLKADKAQIMQVDSQAWLAQPALMQFDGVFIDPPFHQGLVEPIVQQLMLNHWLRDQAWLVIEQEKHLDWTPERLNCQLHREKTTSQSRVGLWRYSIEENPL